MTIRAKFRDYWMHKQRVYETVNSTFSDAFAFTFTFVVF